MSEQDKRAANTDQKIGEQKDKNSKPAPTLVETATYLRIGKYTMALGPLAELTKWMGHVAEGSEKTRESVQELQIDGVNLAKLTEDVQWQLAHVFSLIAVAKARGDWLRIADLLEYEIEPRLAAGREQLAEA